MAIQRRLFNLPAKRSIYMGEPHQLARQRLVEQHQQSGGSLVPAAASLDQATLEADVLAALAVRVGRHSPAELGGVYGIRSVSPTSTSIDIDLTDDAIALLADAILPRSITIGVGPDRQAQLVGVAGLRYASLPRGRVQLRRLDHDGEIVLINAARSWRQAIEALTATLPAESTVCWSAAERTDAERHRAQETATPDHISRQSSVLRRIMLWGTANTVDFAAQLPSPESLAGPHPDLLDSKGSRLCNVGTTLRT